MMKVRVIQAFHDKNSDELYSIGTVLTLDDARAKELMENPLGLVELVEETKATPTVGKRTKRA